VSDDVFLDDSRDEVMELVLSSDEEFTGDEADEIDETERRESRRVWWRETANRFLPGVDAGAVIAAGAALVGLGGTLTVDQAATASEISVSYNESVSRRVTGGPLDQYHEYLDVRWIGQISVAAVAVLLGVLVLARWKEGRHARWSRPVAQAALVLGLIGVVVAILGLTGVIASLPQVKAGGLDSLSG
jgi:hypothetical protein